MRKNTKIYGKKTKKYGLIYMDIFKKIIKYTLYVSITLITSTILINNLSPINPLLKLYFQLTEGTEQFSQITELQKENSLLNLENNVLKENKLEEIQKKSEGNNNITINTNPQNNSSYGFIKYIAIGGVIAVVTYAGLNATGILSNTNFDFMLKQIFNMGKSVSNSQDTKDLVQLDVLKQIAENQANLTCQQNIKLCERLAEIDFKLNTVISSISLFLWSMKQKPNEFTIIKDSREVKEFIIDTGTEEDSKSTNSDKQENDNNSMPSLNSFDDLSDLM